MTAKITVMPLEFDKVKRVVEGTLFASGQPMSLDKLSRIFLEEECPPIGMLVDVLTELQNDYAERGVHLKQVSSGYRFQVSESEGEWVSRLWEEKPPRYSRALLETLALIAYRQPVTRGEIEEIRGVSVSSQIVKTLLERDWIRAVGQRDVPGRPIMYGTTREFLDYFNLTNLDELPVLAEIRDLDSINAELELGDSGVPVPVVAMSGEKVSHEDNMAQDIQKGDLEERDLEEVTEDSDESESEVYTS